MSKKVNRKNSMLFFGIFVSVIIAVSMFLFTNHIDKSNAEEQFTIDSFPQKHVFEPKIESMQTNNKNTLSEDASLSDHQKVIAVLSELNEKANSLFAPGWLHSITTFTGDNDLQNHGEINGTILPLDYTMESWLNIDAKGNVPESLTIQRAMDGQILQAAVRKNEYIWNTMTDEVTEDDVLSSKEGYQSYLYSIIQDLQRQGEYQSADIQTIVFNSVEAVQLTITYEHSEPIQTIDFRQPTVKAEKVLFIDLAKGLPIREQLFVTLLDGSIRNLYQVDFTLFEFTNQPSEKVISYLAQMEGK